MLLFLESSNSFNLPVFQDVTGTTDFEKCDDEDEIVVRTVDPPCYLNNQSQVQGELSTTVQGEHQSEDVSPPTDHAAPETVSSEPVEQVISTEEQI